MRVLTLATKLEKYNIFYAPLTIGASFSFETKRVSSSAKQFNSLKTLVVDQEIWIKIQETGTFKIKAKFVSIVGDFINMKLVETFDKKSEEVFLSYGLKTGSEWGWIEV